MTRALRATSRRSGAAATSSWGSPILETRSVFSRFRLAGAGTLIGVALVGAVFYGLVNTHYLGLVLSKTLGPYSDALAEHAFANPDPRVWQAMARRHRVAMRIERPDGETFAFDENGDPAPALSALPGQVRSERRGPDGTRITFFWPSWTFRESHFPLLAALVIMVVTVVGGAFWFLQRQLRPLAWLHQGVEAVSRGDFTARVPVARSDEIGEVARAFNEMAGEVSRMIDDRERLLADVSHELRSPIARMKVALELLPEGDKRETLSRDLREMEQLTRALLEREALRSRTGPLEGSEVDLAAVAGEVVASFEGRPPGVELVAAGVVPLHADPALMKSLIQNLVDNAVKFSLPDSRPVVTEVRVENGRVVLRVRDDGRGIPAGSEQRVFEPFVKLDRARGHRVGYGVGLNLCQRIVQLHGGTIRLERREPRGTEAVVVFEDPTRIDPSRRDAKQHS